MPRSRAFLLAVAVVGVAGSSPSSEAISAHRFKLGAQSRAAFSGTPSAIDTSLYQFVLDPNITLRGDFDAVSIDLTSYGVPWSSFLYEEALPVSWQARMDAAVVAVTQWGLPVFLQLPVTGDSKSCPPNNASDYPGSNPPSPSIQRFTGCNSCFDYDIVRNPVASFIRQGLVNYALAVTLAFNTTGALGLLNFAVDANRYLEDGCPAALWTSYTGMLAQLYATLKEAFPTLGMMPSWSLETMMLARDGMPCAGMAAAGTAKAPAALVNCAKTGYALLGGVPRDAFAFSAFPSTTAPNNWQPWYVSAPLGVMNASDRGALIVSSTGFVTDTLVVNFANGSTPVQLPEAAATMPLPIASAAAAAPQAQLAAPSGSINASDPPLECVTLVASNGTYATKWLTALAAAVGVSGPTSSGANAILVNFATARDTLFDAVMSSCPCSAPLPSLQPYCDFLSAYRGACQAGGIPAVACEASIKLGAAMGVRDLFDSPREPLYSTLQALRT